MYVFGTSNKGDLFCNWLRPKLFPIADFKISESLGDQPRVDMLRLCRCTQQCGVRVVLNDVDVDSPSNTQLVDRHPGPAFHTWLRLHMRHRMPWYGAHPTYLKMAPEAFCVSRVHGTRWRRFWSTETHGVSGSGSSSRSTGHAPSQKNRTPTPTSRGAVWNARLRHGHLRPGSSS